MLLIGIGKSIFEGTLLGKVLGYTTRIVNPDRLIDKLAGKEGLFENSPFDEGTRLILSRAKIPVGILVDKNFSSLDQVFVPIFSNADGFLLKFAKRLITHNESSVTLSDNNGAIRSSTSLRDTIRQIENASSQIGIVTENVVSAEFLAKQDMMVISLDSWKKLVDSQSVWLQAIPSVLIIKP